MSGKAQKGRSWINVSREGGAIVYRTPDGYEIRLADVEGGWYAMDPEGRFIGEPGGEMCADSAEAMARCDAHRERDEGTLET